MANDLLTIGQFARASWLSIKALRLYDDQGLLHPAYVDPYSSYRYYRPEQARVARAIAILRQLDMPLAEIREIVTGSDQDKIREHLDAHRRVLADRIRQHEQMLERVENFIRKGAVMTIDVTLTTVEATDVVAITLDTTPDTISQDAGPAYARLADVIQMSGINPAGDPRMQYLAMDDDKWTIECSIPVANAVETSGITNLPDGLRVRTFPSVRAAHTVHVGPYDELGMVYQEMTVWLDQQGPSMSETVQPFDVYLNDCNVLPPREWRTELFVPVQ